MYIDFHAHCFPDKLAERAITSLSEASGGLPPVTDGTLAGTDAFMCSRGVDRYVIANITVSPKTEKNVNTFAISTQGDMHIPFGSVHPASPDALSELSRLKDAGIRGIKLHSEYQDFLMDDPAVFPIYERCGELGLIVLFHAGEDIAYPGSQKAFPDRAVALPSLFPKTRFVLAHFGGWNVWEQVLDKLCGLPFYFDTSMSDGYLSPELARRIIRTHGVHRFLFGSDCPWQDPGVTAAFIRSLGLSQAEENAIFYENAISLLAD